ncbi:DNA polymerase domain-containing protein [Trichloromonas sp.]|uniref:Hint domain-containing protein n=1 Tax=Trichloromonas sp. TaxID=3069249 RepID=UPI002A3AC728|nr:DNA polymerase domain-containing protein [Trichloromonas sp.]
MDDREKRQRINELKKLIEQKKGEKDYYKAMQLALKLVINGTYGAFANKYFVCSNADIANSITAHGRDVNQFMMENIEEYFYNKWHNDKDIHNILGVEYIGILNGKYSSFSMDFRQLDYGYDSLDNLLKHKTISLDELDKYEFEHDDIKILYQYNVWNFDDVKPLDSNPIWGELEDRKKYEGDNQIIVYGDTDSCDKDTIISTDSGDFTIENLYNKNINSGSAGITLKGHESVNCKEKILNWDENKKIYYASVKRIIRHKVSKPKWKLKTKTGKEVIVTNDHSMIVFRDGIKMEVKPSNILKTDKILIIKKNK